jgi:hypothetical protein
LLAWRRSSSLGGPDDVVTRGLNKLEKEYLTGILRAVPQALIIENVIERRASGAARGLMEQFAEFAWRELAPPAISNANSVAGCFELAGFGDGDH